MASTSIEWTHRSWNPVTGCSRGKERKKGDFMQRWKFLRLSPRETIQSEFGDCSWEIGKWKRCAGKISLCQRGFHCATTPWLAFSHVQGEILAEVEVDGKSVSSSDGKEAWERMRLIQVWRWRAEDSLALAVFAVERIIGNWERLYPSDIRPLAALDAARQALNSLEEQEASSETSAEVQATSEEVAAKAASASAAARVATAKAIKAVHTSPPETVDEMMAAAARSAAAAAWLAAEAAWSAAEAAWFAAREASLKVQAAAANDAHSAVLSAASAAESEAWVRSMSVAPQAPVASWAEAGASARKAFLEDVSLWMRERVRALPVLSADE
jgi:hypothetical protein